jgi:hypothetical protein
VTEKTSTEFQFQIGDAVIYHPEGVCTTVIGYLWAESIGNFPRIVGYRLDCGITVPKTAIIPGVK